MIGRAIGRRKTDGGVVEAPLARKERPVKVERGDDFPTGRENASETREGVRR